MEPPSSVTEYLMARYQKGLMRALAALPEDMPPLEKEASLQESLNLMKDYDQQVVRSLTLRKISAMQGKKLALVKTYLTEKDQKESRVVAQAIQAS